jgi:hypothetical protein
MRSNPSITFERVGLEVARGLCGAYWRTNWRTETADRLPVRDCAPRLGMYFI